MIAFDKANPQIGILSDTPNLERLDAYLDRVAEWAYRKEYAKQTARFETNMRKERRASKMQRSLSPRRLDQRSTSK
jgi:hypothetical protein